MITNDMKGRKAVVVGIGRTAVSASRLLMREGLIPFVTDCADTAKMAPHCAALDSLGVAYELGGHSEAAFRDAALVVLSPGVPPTIPLAAEAKANGTPVAGELELAYAYCRSRILAVTGTNGKTTTTELLRQLVESCGHTVALAGNNAFPFSEAVMLEPAPEFVVLEVSSYQLESAHEFRPWIAAVLNVTPDHLKRHGTMAAYAAVKNKIFAAQGEGDIAVVNADDPWTAQMTVPAGAALRRFSLVNRIPDGLWLDGDHIRAGDAVVARVADVPLRGRHNLENVLAALSMMHAGRFDWDQVLAGLRSFKGVEHRIEYVATVDGVEFYNDSKSTNIDSLKVALESFDEPVILIAGGEGKGSDYRVLRELVHEKVKRMIALGEDAPLLESAFGDVTAAERAQDMADAVLCAKNRAVAGDKILLSPACASFDMFDDFEHRGRVFKEEVLKLVCGGGKRNDP